MLLMTRRPSATMPGMAAKSLFSSTRLPSWLAACAPELKAMEQSACFMASRSLTPSPVMATVCPWFCSAATRRRFFSGVTRPKTVFSDTAREKSSSVSSAEVSIHRSAPGMPARAAIRLAVWGLSPDMTFTVTP